MLSKLGLSRRRLAAAIGVPLWQRLRAELGERPGAYFMFILWAEVGIFLAVTLLVPILVFSYSYLGTVSAVASFIEGQSAPSLPPNPFLQLSGGVVLKLALPVAVMAATLHWLTTQPEPLSRARKAIFLGLAVALAVGLFVLPYSLPYPVLAALVFVLAVSRRHRLPTPWRVAVVGLVFGAIGTSVLSGPIETLVYARFVPGFEGAAATPEFGRTLAINGFLGALFVLAAGPVAVVWSRPRSWGGRLAVGIGTGALTGALLFGGVGAPAAGLIAESGLYGVALSREGYGPVEWIFKMAVAVNNTFPWTYGAFWLLVGGGALVGGITGLLAPARAVPTKGAQEAEQAWWLAALLDAFPLLAIVTLTHALTLAVLGPAVQNIFDRFGATPFWHPDWIVPAALGQPWLAMTVVQALGLLWLYRLRPDSPLRQPAAVVAYIHGFIGLGFSAALVGLLGPSLTEPLTTDRPALVLVAALVTAILSLETLIVCWRLRPTAADEMHKAPTISRLEWMAGGTAGSLLAAIFYYQFLSVVLNPVLIGVTLIVDLAKTTAPPPGLEWLKDKLSPLFLTHSTVSVWLIVGAAAIGAATWPTAWHLIPRLWSRFKSIYRRAGPSIERLQWRPAWAATALGGALLAVILTAHGGYGDTFFLILVGGAFGLFVPFVYQRLLQVTGGGRPEAASAEAAVAVPPSPSQTRQVVLGALALALLGVGLTTQLVGLVFAFPLALAGLTFVVTLLFIRRQPFERVPLLALAAAFVISLGGLLGLALQEPYQLPLIGHWPWLIYALLVGPAAAVTYHALMAYTPEHARPRVRLAALLGAALLAGLLAYSSQAQVNILGGVTRYDGQRWEAFAADKLAPGGRFNYQLFADRQGRLWFGGAGVVFARMGERWAAYQLVDLFSGTFSSRVSASERARLFSGRMLFAEDTLGRLWVAQGKTFGLFDPELQTRDYSLRLPGQVLTRPLTQLQLAQQSATLLRSTDCETMQMRDADGNLLYLFPRLNMNPIERVTFSPDGTRLLTRDQYGSEVQLWDAGARVPLRALTGQDAIFSPDSRHILTKDDDDSKTARLWDRDGNLIADLTGHTDDIRAIQFSPDGARLTTASDDHTARLWEASTGHLIAVLAGHTDPVNSARFSPDGTRVATAGNDDTIRLWDGQTGAWIATLEGYRPEFSPDGQWIVANDGDNALLWDAHTGALMIKLKGHTAPGPSPASLSPDGRRIITASSDGSPWLWEAQTGALIAKLSGRTDWFDTAAFSPDGRLLLTVSNDNAARLWEVPSGTLIAALEGHTDYIGAATFSLDGTRVVTASNDKTTRLWDARTGAPIATLEGHTEFYGSDLHPARFSPEGTRILVESGGEDTARLWDAGTGKLLTSFAGDGFEVKAAAFSPDGTRLATTGCARYATLAPRSPITGMTLDTAGNMWLATAGSGIIRVDISRDPENTRWDVFSTQNGGLASDDVRAIFADRSGNLWASTARGLNRFDGTRWETASSPVGAANVATVFMEDSRGRLWVGTTTGAATWDGQAWTAFDASTGWPGSADAQSFFEDSRGGVWAGTAAGALRFDGDRWANLVPNVRVTTFAEGPKSVVWVGSQQGLIRYDLVTQESDLFNSHNSGMATDVVQDLLVDRGGGLWVSTFTTNQTAGSPWGAVGLSALFLGYLFVYTYRGYEQTPETHARRLSHKITADPDSLYPAAYALLAEAPDAPGVLVRLADYLGRGGDRAGAESMAALAMLSSSGDVDGALSRSLAALGADASRAWANVLVSLHGLLASALGARRIAEIANLELAVNPGKEAGGTALHARGGTVEALPPFLPKGIVGASHALERVGVALRKYQDVDTASDRLSYLAEALAEVEKAQAATQSVGRPEGVVMATIAGRWRAAITDEINLVSGRAELRLELRTRQARRAAQVTVALRLQNVGRATAENVVVTLEPGQGFTPSGATRVALERLASGRSTPVEFSIAPAEAEAARIVCRVTWDDRVARGANGNAIEFADVVRFYQVAQEFKRIPNPYIVGHPVKSPEVFRGREDVFQFIADNLSGPVQDRTLVLHGQRRTGKTSILYQLLRGRLGPNFLPVLIDMQEVALLINHSADFLSEVAYQLARAARKAGVTVEAPAAEVFAASPTRAFNRFLDALEDGLGDRRAESPLQRAVVMFDEFELIEDKIAEGKLDPDLLGYFRSLVQHRDRLTFIFTGTHRLEEMSHDYWSILFNIALYRRVSFLNPADAARLIREPVVGTLDVDELAVEKIIALTSGHPYFIQLICWALVNHCNAQERNYATINDVNDAVQEILMTGEAHFAYIWQQAGGVERLALAGLAHTLRPGRDWARPGEILETLQAGGSQIAQAILVDVLDRLVMQDVLEAAREGALRYRYQLEVLRLWVEATKSVTALVERGM